MPDAAPSNTPLADAIKAEAQRLGFALCGITDAAPPPHHRHYARWLAEGRAGEMLYLHRQEPKRGDLNLILPSVRSVVSVAFNYSPEDGMAPYPPSSGTFPPEDGEKGQGQNSSLASPVGQTQASSFAPCPANSNLSRSHRPLSTSERGGVPIRSNDQRSYEGGVGAIARYARFDDYHELLWARLESLLAFICTVSPGVNGKIYCDTGPITERDLAMRAGLGWIGKHTNLISRQLGNWFFLGEILLDIQLPSDAPETTHCGTCTRCLPACPTGAITAPYALDARRCISYLTIELKGSIPVELRPLIGTRIYGCDDCLQVCPWNKFARRAADPAIQPRADLTAPDLLALLRLDDDAFREQFRHSPIRRTKRRGLLRNVCIALGNLGDPRAVPALARAAEHDPEPLVREHAQWALEQIHEGRRKMDAVP